MKLRTNLVLLVAGAMLPLLVLVVAGAALLVHHEREAVQREALGRARSAMSAVDAELRGSLTTLLALKTSENLANGDLQAFHKEAQRVLASQPHWLNIGLATPSRIQLMDAVHPWGQHALFGADDDAFDRAIATGQTAIGSVAGGGAIRESAVRLRVPIVQDGATRYVLSVPLKPSSLERVLREQRVPAGWVIVLVDRNRKFIARIPAAPAGDPISESFSAALDRAPAGFFRGRTIEGLETYTPYVTSELSGWVLGVAMPASVVNASARRATTLSIGGLLVALATGIALAWLTGRRIATPVALLVQATQHLGTRAIDRIPRPDARPIEEIALLDDALRNASDTIADRQQRLEAQTKILRETDRRKDEFLATLAHELRNPLAPIVSAVEILKRRALDSSTGRNARDVIERQLRQLVHLVDDLLDVSRISRGKFELDRRPVTLSTIISQALEACAPAITAMAHEVSVAHLPETVWLDADPVRLTQLLVNVLGNACKYTPPGGKIHIEAQIEGGNVDIFVTDNGIGIDPAKLQQIFELFAQADHTAERTREGLGIGLTLAQNIARLHGGSVKALSGGIGTGSTFHIRLPIVAGTGDSPVVAAVPAKVRESARHVLIADDNQDAADTLATILRTRGHRVTTVYSGSQALEAANRTRPDLAILDIEMPGMSGYDVAEKIREQAWGTGVQLIALTGYGRPADQARARDAGFDAHLIKPIDFAAFDRLLNDLSETLSSKLG